MWFKQSSSNILSWPLHILLPILWQSNIKLSGWCKLGRIIQARGKRSHYCCVPDISNLRVFIGQWFWNSTHSTCLQELLDFTETYVQLSLFFNIFVSSSRFCKEALDMWSELCIGYVGRATQSVWEVLHLRPFKAGSSTGEVWWAVGNRGWWKGAGRHIFTWNILSTFQSLLWVSPIAWTFASDSLGFMTSYCSSFCAFDVPSPSSCLCLPTQFVSLMCFIFLLAESNVLSIHCSYTLLLSPCSLLFPLQNLCIFVW